MKIPAPNYTQVPNVFMDEIVRTLNEGEMRVLLYIMRQTFGWHKNEDWITLKFLADKTGYDKRSICRILSRLIDRNLIIKRTEGPNGYQKSFFSLVVENEEKKESYDEDPFDSDDETDIMNKCLPQCPKDTPPIDRRVTPPLTDGSPTKETIQKKDIQKKLLLKDPPDPKPQKKVVVVPSLEKLDISDRLRKDLSSKYPKEKIDKAVDRCIKWKGRSNDQVGIILALQRFDEWKDVIEQEDVKAKNSEFLDTLKHLDDKKIENIMIVVGNSYIEFVSGHNLTRFEISNKDFISQVNEYLSKLKNRKGLS